MSGKFVTIFWLIFMLLGNNASIPGKREGEGEGEGEG
jgi:hypothetical protein